MAGDVRMNINADTSGLSHDNKRINVLGSAVTSLCILSNHSSSVFKKSETTLFHEYFMLFAPLLTRRIFSLFGVSKFHHVFTHGQRAELSAEGIHKVILMASPDRKQVCK